MRLGAGGRTHAIGHWQFRWIRGEAIAKTPVDCAVERCAGGLGFRRHVGEGAILKTDSVVEQDVCLGRFVHVLADGRPPRKRRSRRPHAHGARRGRPPGVRAGADVRIGVGAVVTRAIADGLTVVGVPAARAVEHRAAELGTPLRAGAQFGGMPRRFAPRNPRLLQTPTIARSEWPLVHRTS